MSGIAMNLNRKIIVRFAPENYPRQEGLTCGETNIKGLLAGFNVPYSPPPSLRLRIRIFGYSFIQDISELLEAHGLSAPVRKAKRLSDQEKIRVIQKHIDRDQPVLVAIGNGYLRRGEFTPIARHFIGHFITIYGYSNDESNFYIYDPYLEGSYPDEIPAGNDIRKYNELLRDWRGPVYYKFIGMDHVYLPVAFDGN